MGIDAQMLIRIPRVVTADEVKREAVKAQIALGTETLNVYKPGEFSWADSGRHCLSIVDRFEQDGEPILPRAVETLIEVHLRTRYYGVGYERGDLLGILAVARWFRIAFAPCEVWYGGDSSGVCAEPLDDIRENDLWVHFMSEQGLAYFDRPPHDGRRIRCNFCDIDASEYMGGGDRTGHACPSCGQHWVRFRDGRVFKANDKYEPLSSALADGGAP